MGQSQIKIFRNSAEISNLVENLVVFGKINFFPNFNKLREVFFTDTNILFFNTSS